MARRTLVCLLGFASFLGLGLFAVALIFIGGCTPTREQVGHMNAKSLFRDAQVAELVLAAERGDIERISALSKEGVDVNTKGRYNLTPLLRSIEKKQKESFSRLLMLGADP